MPSLMKASPHARWARRTRLLRRIIGAKVYGVIGDWRLTIWNLVRAVTRYEQIAWRVSFTIGIALVAAARPPAVSSIT
jgi:hypothetical protein